jgi:microcystin-dependent protein
MDYYIGTMTLFAGNFAPKNWMFCQGQILAIATNQALFSILGTTYGGDGRTTFGLPDLRGRVPVSQGSAPGVNTITLGEKAGVETVGLVTSQIPAHNHGMTVSTANADVGNPQGAVYAKAIDSGSGTEYQIYQPTANVSMNANSLAPAGQGQPHNNLPPLIAINYIICIYGLFPSRN